MCPTQLLTENERVLCTPESGATLAFPENFVCEMVA